MAKRFIDTEVYRKAWFADLKPEQQQLWFYLCINCDIAGIWDKNYRLASFELRRAIDDTAFECFGARVIHLEDNKLWIPGFITFQYGVLSPDCKPHRAVISLLQKRSIDPKTLTVLKGFGNPLERVQDKDKDKDQDKDKEKEGGTGEAPPASVPKRKRARKDYPPEFEQAYKQYPRQEGKSSGLKTYLSEILTIGDHQDLVKAIGHYAELCRRENREHRHIKHFGTFMNCWRDYLDAPKFEQSGGEQRVKCDKCTSGLIRAVNRSSGQSDWCACSCPAGRAKSSYVRFDENRFERVA